MNDQINNVIEQRQVERLLMQRALSAANCMMLQLNIQQGSQLSFVLSQPEAKTNQEAIYQCILRNCEGALVDEQNYDELLGELKTTLQKAQLEVEYG